MVGSIVIISSSVNCLMDTTKIGFEIIHCQGQVMCRGQSQNQGKLDNFGHQLAHLNFSNYPKLFVYYKKILSNTVHLKVFYFFIFTHCAF